MKISLIIPCYNVEQYIGPCLDSVSKAISACPSVAVEVICVDDGSTDKTGCILDQRVQSLQMKVIHQQNAGEGAARNTGLQAASGEWIMYLDSDDLLVSSVFSELMSTIRKYPDVDLISYGSKTFPDSSALVLDSPVAESHCEIRRVDIASSLPNFLSQIAVWQMVYRTSVFKDVRFKAYVVGADLVYTSQCFGLAKSIAVNDAICHAYRVRSNSMAHCPISVRKMQDMILYLADMFKNFQSCGKMLGPTFWRGRGNAWIERCGAELVQRDSFEYRKVFDLWIESLRQAAGMSFFSRWQKFVINSVLYTRSRFVVRALCRIPYELKCKGFHR